MSYCTMLCFLMNLALKLWLHFVEGKWILQVYNFVKVQWLTLKPHSYMDPASNPLISWMSFCVELARSHHVCIGFPPFKDSSLCGSYLWAATTLVVA